MPQNLSGRVFAVTGASGNLGRAVASALESAGARLILLDRSGPTEDRNDGRVLAFGGLDLTDADAIGTVLDAARDRFGRFDGLVATAGAYRGGTPVERGTWADWEAMMDANLRTAVAAAQAAAPRLGPGGRIVTVGARGGLIGAAGSAAYAASKAGVLRLTESLAEELKDRGVTVNGVLPAVIDTPQNRAAMPDADASRWTPPEDIAAVILFLLSDAARAVTGALIPVYGGA